MHLSESTLISIRVTKSEKDKFKILSALENKSVTDVIKELINKELNAKKLTAKDIRKLPKEMRISLLKQMTEKALPVYNKYKKEIYIDETGDGIEWK